MKLVFLGLFLSFTLPLFSQETITKTIEHDGEMRSYILYVPQVYEEIEEVPLVLCFHGYGSSAQTIAFYANFQEIADTANFIIAFPQGAIHDNSTHWNVEGWINNSPYDDIGFADLLINEISSEYAINQDRIYSTGMSNGGFMSFLLACQLSDKIAAVASVTGSITPQNLEDCSPTKFIPFLQIHGTSDNVIPYELSVNYTESIPTLLDYWTSFNECEEDPTFEALPNISTTDFSTVEKYTYTDCTSNIENIHFKVLGGGHDWPGAWGNMDINASKEIWDFFAQYDISGLITSTTSLHESISTPISILPNPTTSFVRIENIQSDMEATIYSLDGTLIRKQNIQQEDPMLSLLGLTPNMYVLKVGNEFHKVVVID